MTYVTTDPITYQGITMVVCGTYYPEQRRTVWADPGAPAVP